MNNYRLILICLVYAVVMMPLSCSPGRDKIEVGEPEFPQLPSCSEKPSSVICKEPQKWDVEQLRARLGGKDHVLWADGNTLTFVYQAEANKVFLNGGIQTLMLRLPDTDLWTLSVRVQNLSEATIRYSFTPFNDTWPDHFEMNQYMWRGSEAPPEPQYADPLRKSMSYPAFI